MAKNNATTAKPSGTAPSANAGNTPQHKLLAMGHQPKGYGDGGKKTPA